MRHWSEAYVNLTHSVFDEKSQCWCCNPDHVVGNWVSAQSVATLLAPYSAGSAKSKLIQLLTDGHEEVKLSSEEMSKLCV